MAGGQPLEDDYEGVCAKCWEGPVEEDWFRRTFPVLVAMSEKRLLRRHLCPECSNGFADDAARTDFLAGTIPRAFIRLPAPERGGR